MNENYEKLEKVIELLNSHTVMVGSIVLAESIDRFNQVRPSRLLNKEERESLTKAMELLLEIRNDERKREQDEHAIAFAKAGEEE
jgi:NAD-specific glutamate dehydrogenase